MRSEVKRLGNFAAAHWLVIGSTGLVLLVFAPAVVQGGLLADDYIKCLGPIQAGGYGPFLREIWRDTGIVRPAQLIEVLLISKTCTHLPFGLVMLVPLSLKFAAGLLLWGLLRDLRVRPPWPEVGVAMWLLEPVGTEAALWPSALHVHLGLVCALAALRLYRRGFLVSAAFASAGAALSVEQVIFALPFAVWVTGSREHRRRATAVATVLMAIVIVAYATWPGHNERQALTLGERWHNVVTKGAWYVFFPTSGVGLYSGALGFLWAFPYSIAVVVVGAASGALLFARRLHGQTTPSLEAGTGVRTALAVGVLIVLVNVPLIVTEVGYSARTFTPTWLVPVRRLRSGGGKHRVEASACVRRFGRYFRGVRHPLAGAQRVRAGANRPVQPCGRRMDRRADRGRLHCRSLRCRPHRREPGPSGCVSPT